MGQVQGDGFIGRVLILAVLQGDPEILLSLLVVTLLVMHHRLLVVHQAVSLVYFLRQFEEIERCGQIIGAKILHPNA